MPANPTDLQWQRAQELWPDDSDHQFAAAHALARVPEEVGWVTVAGCIRELRHFEDRHLSDKAREVMAMHPRDQIAYHVLSIIQNSIEPA